MIVATQTSPYQHLKSPPFMSIRKAKPKESSLIAQYLLWAMEDIVFKFIGERSPEKALYFLQSLTEESSNQYSYENCWVLEQKEAIVAVALVYDGAQLEALRKPVANRLHNMFNRSLEVEDETQAGEQYIDCIAVHPSRQGEGFGTQIINFLIEKFVHKRNEILGLLVDKDNPSAKRLYLKLGFKIVGDQTLAGKLMEHLQIGNR